MGAALGTAARTTLKLRALNEPRTARVQMGSRFIGDYVYHPALAKADVRNAVLRSFAPEDYFDRLAWLYGPIRLDGDERA